MTGKTMKIRIVQLFTVGLIFVFLAGCCGITLPIPNILSNNTQNSTAPAANSTCSDKTCFIAAANDCENASLTVTENVGTFTYSSSDSCIFTKTLVSLNANETQEMKKLLEGKNMTCLYDKGKFDQRWVNSLVYGIENCTGDLKNRLGDLTVFT